MLSSSFQPFFRLAFTVLCKCSKVAFACGSLLSEQFKTAVSSSWCPGHDFFGSQKGVHVLLAILHVNYQFWTPQVHGLFGGMKKDPPHLISNKVVVRYSLVATPGRLAVQRVGNNGKMTKTWGSDAYPNCLSKQTGTIFGKTSSDPKLYIHYQTQRLFSCMVWSCGIVWDLRRAVNLIRLQIRRIWLPAQQQKSALQGRGIKAKFTASVRGWGGGYWFGGGHGGNLRVYITTPETTRKMKYIRLGKSSTRQIANIANYPGD